MHPSSTSGAQVAYSSTGDVSGTYWAGILSGRPWIRMYVARHQQKLGRSCRRRSGFVVELRISYEQQTVRIIVISICRRRLLPDGSTTCRPRSLEPYVGFAPLNVFWDELNDCAWNVCLQQLSD